MNEIRDQSCRVGYLLTPIIFYFVLVFGLTGCFTRSQIHDPRKIEGQRGSIVVHLKSSEPEVQNKMVITEPQITGNRLRGIMQTGKEEGENVEIPLEDILYFEVVKLDKKKVLISSVIFVALAYYALRNYAPGLEVK